MNKINYQQEMQKVLSEIKQNEKLLLHSCCGPCSTSVLEQLVQKFCISLHYYNPNIWPKEEYDRRRLEQKEVLQKMGFASRVKFLQTAYVAKDFYDAVAGLETCEEGGGRCKACFSLRLEEAAKTAKKLDIKWFTTTLTVSPHKNAAMLNALGAEIGKKHGVNFLPSDFKKKNGYRRSLLLSEELNLYRQSYCGCKFSIN